MYSHLHGGPCSGYPTPEVQSRSCLFSVPYLDEIVQQPISSASTMTMVHEFNDPAHERLGHICEVELAGGKKDSSD